MNSYSSNRTGLRWFAKLDWLLIILAFTSTVIGILNLYGGDEIGRDRASKNILWFCLGVIIMLLLAFSNYQNIGSYSWILYGISIFLLCLVFVPFIGDAHKGARSWIRVWIFGFQPVELMKLVLVITLSKYLILRESEIDKFKELIIPFLMTAIPLILIIIQPDLGSAILFLPLLFLMLFIGGANVNIIFGLVTIGFFSLFIPMYLEYYDYTMIENFTSEFKDTKYKGLVKALDKLDYKTWWYIRDSNLRPNGRDANFVKILLANKELFLASMPTVYAKHSSLFYAFFANKMPVFITTIITAVAYGLGLLGYYLTKARWMKIISTLSLIVSLTLLSSFTFKNLVKLKPHQIERIVAFVNPKKFAEGPGFQTRQSLITLGSGQALGKGIDHKERMIKSGLMPEWFNDFIFAAVGEQMGFWGSLILLLCLFGLIYRGITIAISSKDDFGALLAGGISAIFFAHVIINIGINLGLFPVTGIPLNFVSYGGSNMLISYAALGILLNINMRRFINA